MGTEPVAGPSLIPPPEPGSPRRLTERPLPSYRYVPGLQPHPFRHPDGHLYTDGSAPEEVVWRADLPWREDPDWLWGCELFDQRFYWEAHEAWEALWHQVPRGGQSSELLQGLIQAAAFVLKQHMGHTAGAKRLLARASSRLERVAKGPPEVHRGLDLDAVIAQLHAFEQGGDWPTLRWRSGHPGPRAQPSSRT